MSTSRPTGRGARLALAVAIAAAVLAACHPKYETIIPETTKVAAEATRDALESYDPATGELRFAADTPTLQNLEPGDVLVSEPAAAAPGGLLRKMESVRREGGEVVVETTQANLTDAITQGQLTAQGDLKAEQVVSALGNLPGVTASFRGDTAGMPHVGTGDGYEFHVGFDEVALDIGAGDVNVAVVLNGELYFNAGWKIDLGIEPCLEVPPVCVDRFEAYVGVTERLKVSFSGEANAKLTKEVSVATYYFKPLVFFIGPVPVVVVPSIEVFVGAEGSVSLRFAYGLTEEANAVVGAKWTDDGGWQDITGFGVSLAQQDSFQVDATMGAHAYARAVASLKFYDVAGPALGLRLGVEFDAEVPRDPILLVRGGSLQGYFDVSDPEGGDLKIVAVSDKDGTIPLTYTFKTTGRRDVVVTATDPHGATASISLALVAVSSPPIVSVSHSGDAVVNVPYIITAGAYDPVGGTLLCSAITWSVAAPDVLSGGGCEATVTFKSQGPRQVVVTATNTYGTSTTEVITLTVGPEPEDKPPVITSFHIRAAEGPQRLGEGPADIYACPTGYYCEVPPDAVLWNGQARYLEDYVGPLYLEVEATDDNGAPLTVTWTCSAGGSSAPVPYEGEGVYSCNPFFPGQTIVVSVSVSDCKSAATASRSFFMRSTVN